MNDFATFGPGIVSAGLIEINYVFGNYNANNDKIIFVCVQPETFWYKQLDNYSRCN